MMINSLASNSQTLFYQILKTADFPESEQSKLTQQFESEVFSQTLKTLLSCCPMNRKKG